MRCSGFAGFCALLFASQAIVGCDDSEDRKPRRTHGGSSGAATGGDDATGGTSSEAGEDGGGTAGTAGAFVNGGSDSGGGGSAGTAGNGAGTAGTGGTPSCTLDSQCADLNPCTDDLCTAGECVHTDNTLECDDGNRCTSDDACSAGACKGTNNSLACDDLSSCTSADVCANGTCGGAKDLLLCPSCTDGLNLIQNCDFTDGLNHWADQILFGGGATQTAKDERLTIDITGGGVNVYDVQPRQEPLSLKQGMKYKLRMVVGASVDRDVVVSLTKATTPYTVYSKGDSLAGGYTLRLKKQAEPFERVFTMTQPTDDGVKLELKIGGAAGNPSTVYFDDVYLAEVKCTGNADCNDSNECTTDACDTAAGTCSWTASSGACTTDLNPCTTDACDAGECKHTALADDDACTDDANDCTADVCTAGLCTHAFDTNVCACAVNANCDDNNACTDDTCGAGACQNANNTASCDDDNPCTLTDTCAAGDCSPGTNVCFDCTGAGNLLTNCDLSAGDSGWLPGFFDGGGGTQTVTNGRLVVNITAGSTAGYKVQPRQEGITLEQNKTYRVRFNALASINRGMALSITRNSDPYTSYSGEQLFNLTPQMQEFHFDFTTPDTALALAKFEIRLGGVDNNPMANSVTFDNLSLALVP